MEGVSAGEREKDWEFERETSGERKKMKEREREIGLLKGMSSLCPIYQIIVSLRERVIDIIMLLHHLHHVYRPSNGY